jgi:hypothetical protein
MDKEQIRIAVAEELGWVFERTGQSIERDYHIGCVTWIATSPEGKLFEYRKGYDEIEYLTKESVCNDRVSNYPESLDDCQEMLNNLKDEELHIFDKHLSEIPEVGYAWLAKPIDLCVAFLKTRTDFKKARENGVGARKDVGVLIYYDDYNECARFKFYWGGVGYHDDRILDFYYDTDDIIEKYYEGDEDKYEKAVDEIFNFDNTAEYMENDYSLHKGFEETVQFFEKEEVGWKWIHADRDLFKD